MAVNLLDFQVPAIGHINLKAPDGSPLLDAQTQQPAYARVHSPASKIYEVAHATKRRKAMKRVRDAGGRIEAAADDSADNLEFLVAITEEFVGASVPLPEGESGSKAMVRAVLSNPALGFIRDQIEGASSDWGSFSDGSANG
jgi:hypothetical protein